MNIYGLTIYLPFEKDEELYATDALFPEHSVEIIDIIQFRDKQLAKVKINPVQYNPVTKQLIVHSSINFSVDFVNGMGFVPSESEGVNTILNNTVLNPLPPANPSPGPRQFRGEILIITPYKYKEAVDKFVAWKRRLGYLVIVETRNYWAKFDVENTVAGYNPDYLILIGDINDIPASHSIKNGDVTDLFYACDKDANGIMKDHMIDMTFGRISVSSLEKANTVLRKIITYESNPPVNADFYNNAMGLGLFEDVRNLNNGNLLPVVFSLCCFTGQFNVNDCITEEWMLNDNGGAVAVISSTRFTSLNYFDIFLYGLLDAMWSEHMPLLYYNNDERKPVRTLGDIYRQGWLRIEEHTGFNYSKIDPAYQRDHYFPFYISGDPSMEIWADEPEIITATYPGYITEDAPFIVSHVSCDFGRATLVSGGYVIGRADIFGGHAVIDMTYPPITETITLTISRTGFRPLIDELENLYARVISPVNTRGVISLRTSEKQVCRKGIMDDGKEGIYVYKNNSRDYFPDPEADLHSFILDQGYLSYVSGIYGIFLRDLTDGETEFIPKSPNQVLGLQASADHLVWGEYL